MDWVKHINTSIHRNIQDSSAKYSSYKYLPRGIEWWGWDNYTILLFMVKYVLFFYGFVVFQYLYQFLFHSHIISLNYPLLQTWVNNVHYSGRAFSSRSSFYRCGRPVFSVYWWKDVSTWNWYRRDKSVKGCVTDWHAEFRSIRTRTALHFGRRWQPPFVRPALCQHGCGV